MAKLVQLHNGRVKLENNRFGGDTSKSETRCRRSCNYSTMARRQRFLDSLTASEMADYLAGGAREDEDVPAVRVADREIDGEKPRFYIGDIVVDADVTDSYGRKVVLETECEQGSRFIHLMVGEGGRLQSAIMR